MSISSISKLLSRVAAILTMILIPSFVMAIAYPRVASCARRTPISSHPASAEPRCAATLMGEKLWQPSGSESRIINKGGMARLNARRREYTAWECGGFELTRTVT